jgi:hypothetical protein
VKWLRDSGLEVNEGKTELVLFYIKDCRPYDIRLNHNVVTPKIHMNVVGVIFDPRLQWFQHLLHTITRAKKMLNTIKLIKRCFNNKELLDLITSDFFPTLYYNFRYGTCL